MFNEPDWMTDQARVEAFSSEIREVCSLIPVRGDWEPNDRIAYAMASFRLAKEHHESICLLFARGNRSSALALARPMAEVSLRTYWLIHTATEKDIQDIGKGKEQMPLLGAFSKWVSGEHNGLLSSFTHGTTRAMAAHFLEGQRRGQTDAVMLAQASFFLGAAGFEIAQVLYRIDLMEQLAAATPAVDPT